MSKRAILSRILSSFMMAAVISAWVLVPSSSARTPELVNNVGKKVSGTTFTLQGSLASDLETASGTFVVCTSYSAKPKIEEGNLLKKVVIDFTNCEEGTLTGKSCTTAGKAEGEIETAGLEGQIGYVSEAAKTVGLTLWPSARSSSEKEKHIFDKPVAEFKCGPAACPNMTYKVTGALTGELTPINMLKKELKLEYVPSGGGEQKLKKLEGVEGEAVTELEVTINANPIEKMSEKTDAELTGFGEEVELRA